MLSDKYNIKCLDYSLKNQQFYNSFSALFILAFLTPGINFIFIKPAF